MKELKWIVCGLVRLNVKCVAKFKRLLFNYIISQINELLRKNQNSNEKKNSTTILVTPLIYINI